jgi:hypothetical protein
LDEVPRHPSPPYKAGFLQDNGKDASSPNPFSDSAARTMLVRVKLCCAAPQGLPLVAWRRGFRRGSQNLRHSPCTFQKNLPLKWQEALECYPKLRLQNDSVETPFLAFAKTSPPKPNAPRKVRLAAGTGSQGYNPGFISRDLSRSRCCERPHQEAGRSLGAFRL